MLSPRKIMTWLTANVKSMRLSRLKTLSAIVAAAMKRCGSGVLALGRAMTGSTSAKHNIKRVWRFLRNSAVEVTSIYRALFSTTVCRRGPIIVLADWTDLSPHQSLVLALARDGRAVPFYSKSIPVACGQGGMIRAENDALAFLSTLIPNGRQAIIVADRGFSSSRWIGTIRQHRWCFVQRLKKETTVYNGRHYCRLSELPLQKGRKAHSYGNCTVTESNPFSATVVALWDSQSDEPWYLATNLELTAGQVTRIYRMRMWIEALFRDLKERQWGLKLKKVRLSEPQRHDRLFVVLFLAWLFLSAMGAAAERRGWSKGLKANTSKKRVLSLMNIGFYCADRLKRSLLKLVRDFRVPQLILKTGDC